MACPCVLNLVSIRAGEIYVLRNEGHLLPGGSMAIKFSAGRTFGKRALSPVHTPGSREEEKAQ